MLFTRFFLFIICLFRAPLCFGLFVFPLRLFLLAERLPLCNDARHIRQNLEQSTRSTDSELLNEASL